MRVLLIYAHPEPKSFNGAMFRKAQETLLQAGHQVRVSDLYAMQFDPVSGRDNFTGIENADFFKQQLEEVYATKNGTFVQLIAAEQEKVEWCDIMIWQFPLWWFSVPGILKGWVDRVFAMGRFYGDGRIYETGVFKEKKALLALTTGGNEDAYLKDGLQGDIHGILRPIQRGIFEFTGFTVLAPHVVYGPARLPPGQRGAELHRWQQRVLALEAEPGFEVGRY
ncbi:NAD(P)H-dependent oxidoreductase [Dyadobacter sp. LJ53]|uniref:NAD(P)H-dependent oxidoreductase n=1 Tax=Dyadobacter chenwenxiniae TaxID=2906456 RepID=UPI001F32284A|nr:NAD(P)H-dependent oxidoreductase [Dyadobacter chenwenxiniae]MCF0048511.1 NAD(P)H-dependent oxidoreductase [Dyadobacter chenwenxiniae]